MVVCKGLLNDIEKVGYGTVYERIILNNLIKKIVIKTDIGSILEYPATDLLGDSQSLYSGFKVPTERAKTFPNKFREYDLVWNFCKIEETFKPCRLLSEMLKLASKNVLFVGQNIFNPGVPLHKIYHNFLGLNWNHGNLRHMNLAYAINLIHTKKLTVLEKGYLDAPVFVLDLYEFGSLLRRHSENKPSHNKMLLNESPFEGLPKLFKPIFNHHWYLLCKK